MSQPCSIRIKAGLDKNESTLQYSYSRHDHGLAMSDENKTLDAGFDWLWDTNADEIVLANESALNQTEEEE